MQHAKIRVYSQLLGLDEPLPPAAAEFYTALLNRCLTLDLSHPSSTLSPLLCCTIYVCWPYVTWCVCAAHCKNAACMMTSMLMQAYWWEWKPSTTIYNALHVLVILESAHCYAWFTPVFIALVTGCSADAIENQVLYRCSSSHVLRRMKHSGAVLFQPLTWNIFIALQDSCPCRSFGWRSSWGRQPDQVQGKWTFTPF